MIAESNMKKMAAQLQQQIDIQQQEVNRQKQIVANMEKELQNERNRGDELQRQMNKITLTYDEEIQKIKKKLAQEYQSQLAVVDQLLKENAEANGAASKWEKEFKSLKKQVEAGGASANIKPRVENHPSRNPRSFAATASSPSTARTILEVEGTESCPACGQAIPTDEYIGHIQMCVNMQEDNEVVSKRPKPNNDEKTTTKDINKPATVPPPNTNNITIKYKDMRSAEPAKDISVPKTCTVRELMAAIGKKEGKVVKKIIKGSPMKEDKKLQEIPDLANSVVSVVF